MPKTNKSISFLKNKKQTIMAKYELMEKTENNGDVWYYIRKDEGLSVENSWTKNLEQAEKMFEQIQKGKPVEPIIQILKTIEVND
jgi:hypothetical protein